MKTLIGGGGQVTGTVLNALFALGFAVLIWAAVGARLTAVETFRIPFELEVPPDLVVEYRDPPAPPGGRPLVEVVVRGPHEILAKMAASEISGRRRLDERAILEKIGGEQLVDIVAKDHFRVTTKGVEVTAVSPSQIKIALSRIGRKELRVKEDVMGEPAPGFRRTAVVIVPDVIEVNGPQALLEKYAGPLKTEPIDLAGRAETFSVNRKVRTPEGLVAQDRVGCTVVIEAEPVTEEFELPLLILTTSENFKQKYEIAPPRDEWRARVTLRGPVESLRTLRARLQSLQRYGGGEGEPLAFIRLIGPLEKGKNDQLIEVVNLPRDVTHVATGTKGRFPYELLESKP